MGELTMAVRDKLEVLLWFLYLLSLHTQNLSTLVMVNLVLI